MPEVSTGRLGSIGSAVSFITVVSTAPNGSVAGISVKTQELYLVVFVFRYLDLFTSFYSWYVSSAKMFYIAITAYTIWKVKYSEPFRSLYNGDQDSFPHWKYLLVPSLVLGFSISYWKAPYYFSNFDYTGSVIVRVLWQTSICLEAVAILPQLEVLRRYRLVENLTGKFMLSLGSYRALYILNWVYRYNFERFYRHHWEVSIFGILQTILYLHFFFQYGRAAHCCGCSKEKTGTIEEEDDLIFEEAVEQQNTVMTTSLTDPLLSPTENVSLDVASGESFSTGVERRKAPVSETSDLL